jgi:hypothetical protein
VSARQIAARYAIGTGPDDQEPPAQEAAESGSAQ